MFCTKCGKQIPDDALFCNYCGAAVEVIPKEPAAEPVQEKPSRPKSFFEEFQWNDPSYPDINAVTKTEDIDFDWNADPKDVRDRYTRELSGGMAAEVKAQADILRTEDIIPKPATPAPKEPVEKPEKLSTAEKVDKFYTFNTKNEEFQQLLNKEYEKVKAAGAIGQEKSVADERAAERFESRVPDTSMDAFLEREGAVRPYEPKAFESDVLKRIEAQEAAKEQARMEAEARERAIEEARAKAEKEAREKLEEERRLAEEERIRAEEEARARAEEEARLRAEKERAAAEAEEEARIRAEKERAAARAEEEARIKAEEERLKAEADLRAAQEAAKIRAQQAARIAAEEEEKFRAEQRRKLIEEEQLKARQEEERLAAARKELEAAEIKSDNIVTEHTTRMREDDATKLKAAISGFRESVEKEASLAQPEPSVGIKPDVPKPDMPNIATPEAIEARRKTQDKINEMAKARDEFFAEFEDDYLSADKAAPAPADETPAPPVQPATDKPVGGDPMPTPEGDIVKTRVIKKADVLAGLDETKRISKAEVKAGTDEDFLSGTDTAGQAKPQAEAAAEKPVEEDLLSRFVEANEETQKEEFPGEGFAIKEEPAVMPEDDRGEYKPGLAGTVVLPGQEIESDITHDFDSYGDAEAENYRRLQENAILEETDETEAEEKSGKGRIVLKIILVLLIIVFAVELAGIGIKFLAPQSKAAEIIDNQVEKILQLITGEKDSYSLTDIDYYI